MQLRSPFMQQLQQNMRMRGVVQFLSYLSSNRDVAINTQKTALNALAFLYNQFINQPLGDMGFSYAKRHWPFTASYAWEEIP